MPRSTGPRVAPEPPDRDIIAPAPPAAGASSPQVGFLREAFGAAADRLYQAGLARLFAKCE